VASRSQPDDAAAELTSRSGVVELLGDVDRPGGWLLLVDRIRQSYVDLDDPGYLDFEYMQSFAEVFDALPGDRLAVTHIGGGACTLARYVAVTRPGSPQIVLEPDAALTALVRARLPFPRQARIRVRATDGRSGIAAMSPGCADVVVLDAFAGGRVPSDLTSREFFADVARVLRSDGVLLVNIADGPPTAFSRRMVATVCEQLPEVLLIADPGVVKGRRFGNIVIAASRAALSQERVGAATARAMVPRTMLAGAALSAWTGAARPITDAEPLRSPEPPDELWRISRGECQ
jgi:spermidine synthase